MNEHAGIQLNWQIVELKSETAFAGLGKFKNSKLPAGTRVIQDAKNNLLAIPGVVGGDSTKVTPESQKVLVEIANFEASEVGRNAFRVSYRSEASKIFGGQINLPRTELALKRLHQLLGDSGDLKSVLNWQQNNLELEINSLEVDFDYLVSRLDGRGLSYWQPLITSKLAFLGNYNAETNQLNTNIFYGWIKTQDDLLEELIRLIGFENLQPQDLFLNIDSQPGKEFGKINQLKIFVREFGFDEIVTRPFVPAAYLQNQSNAVKLINPSSSLEPFFRDNLVTTLLKVYAQNMLKGHKNINLFEINQISFQQAGNLIQSQQLGLIYSSEDPYLATSIINQLAAKSGLKLHSTTSAVESFGRVTTIELENGIQARITQISNSLKKLVDLPLERSFWTLEIEVDNLPALQTEKYYDIGDFPAITRSYSLAISKTLTWSQLKTIMDSALQSLDKTEVKADLKAIYQPKERIEIDAKSDKINFGVRFQSNSRTLNGQEIVEWENRVMNLISN